MKKLYFYLPILFVYLQVNSQNTEGLSIFNSYYLKSRIHTANTPFLIRQEVSFKKTDKKSFVINGNINPRDYYEASIRFVDSLKDSGIMYYKYIGEGYMIGTPVNFQVETSIDLERVTEGYGYEKVEGMEFKNCEINLIYWPKGQSELYTKENFYIYPKGNVVQKNYISRFGFPEINLPFVLEQVQNNSLITGTYDRADGGVLKIAELKDGKLLIQFIFGLGFFEDLISPQGNKYVYRKREIGLCNFELSLQDGILKASTLNGGYNCGYGQGVQHDGIYSKVSSIVPYFEARL